MSNLLLVYGTLKKGFPNHRIIEGASYVGTGSIQDMAMYNLGHFPGIAPGKSSIHGEIYDIDDATLARCDTLEGHPDFYTRVEAPNKIDGRVVWFYLYPHLTGREPLIESGVWG